MEIRNNLFLFLKLFQIIDIFDSDLFLCIIPETFKTKVKTRI